jgi:ubiquinone/menaquinone biosynthesis C-methylase UbiE
MSAGRAPMQQDPMQREVVNWFDGTYRKLGFDYLRPLAAYPIFLQLLGAREGETLLDVACGPGLLLKAALLRGVAPAGVDISRAALDIAGEYVPEARLEQGNAEELPFPDGSFHHVTCIGAIERFLDRPRALAEMMRVGRDDARYCFMVRNASTIVWRFWRKTLKRRNTTGHQDALTLEQWRALFHEAGFEVVGVYIDQWLRQRLRRVLRGGRQRDFREPEPIARPILPLRFANEFIFLLRKAEGDAR